MQLTGISVWGTEPVRYAVRPFGGGTLPETGAASGVEMGNAVSV